MGKVEVKLDTKTSRRELAPNHEPYWKTITRGKSYGYRRTSDGPGSWWVRIIVPALNLSKKAALGQADDDGAHGGIDHETAHEMARKWFLEQERIARAMREAPLRGGPYTVAHAMKEYLADCRCRRVKGLVNMQQVVDARILPFLGRIELVKLTREQVAEWLHTLADSPRLKTGIKRVGEAEYQQAPATEDELRARQNTANRQFSILKAALNLALENRRVSIPPVWREVKPFKDVSASRTRFLSAEDQARLVNACPPDFRRLVQGALLTGARYSELARLLVQDFDAQTGTVYIAPGKTKKDRHVVLTMEGIAFFTQMVTGRTSGEHMFLQDGKTRTEARKTLGLTWGHSEQVPLMAGACEAAGLEPLGFHQLRHSYASLLINKGVALVYVAEQLGHKGIRMVEQHYGHLSRKELTDSIRTLVPSLGIVEDTKVAGLAIKRA